MINAIFSDTINVRRRDINAAVDVLNNPNYGSPEAWSIVYQNIKVRIAYSGKQMEIKSTGELIYPTATVYYSKQYTIQSMDRIIIVNSAGIPKGIEYTVESVYPSYLMSGIVDHMQASIHLPI